MAASDTRRPDGLDPHRIRVGLAITVTIGIAVGAVVTFATGGRDVLAGMTRLPLGWLLLALVLSALSWLGQGLGFAALSHRGVRGHLLRMTAAFLGGDFAALVTPFGSGGIPVGVYCLTREGLTAGESSAIIAMHSLLTGAFFLLTGAAAAVLVPVHTGSAEALVWSGVGAIAVVMVFVIGLAARPRKAAAWLEGFLGRPWLTKMLGDERAHRFAETANSEALHFATNVEMLTREKPSQLALSFLGLFLSRVALIVCLPVIMYGLGWRGSLLPLLATAVGAMALAIVSPTPGGSGAVEAATAALLATQAPVAIAGAATLLWRAVTYYTELLAGWALFTHYLAGPRKKTPAEEIVSDR